MYDLVIRGGTVIDGSGAPRFRADVGVVGDRVATVGLVHERGAVEVDAEGHFVTPGFIDPHTHLDAQVHWDPLGTCSSWQGVTTVIMGNCGFGLAPCAEARMDLVIRSLERAEDISRAAMLAGIRWDWETFPEYFDALDRLPKGINYSAYVGHCALRSHVMGERAFESEATEEDLAGMVRHLEEALDAGAMGLSTTRNPSHLTADGRPVASRMASWDELYALGRVMRDAGRGLIQLSNEKHADPDEQRRHLDRLRTLAVETGRPMTFTVGTSRTDASNLEDYLRFAEEVNRSGGRVVLQTHAREFLAVIGFPVALPFDRLPAWQEVRGRPVSEQAGLLSDPGRRARLVEEAMQTDYARAIGTETPPPNYDLMRILDSPLGPYRTVAQVAARRGVTPVDVIIDASLESGMRQLFAQPFANFDMDEVRRVIEHPHSVVAISDSGAHVTQIIDASVPTFLLGHWVRQEGAFSWEEAVRMLTFDPALIWGLPDRGLLREGSFADLTVFDPQRVGPGMPAAADDLPTGARRLVQKADGIRATVVGGEVLMEDNEHTGRLPGRLLRRVPVGGR